MFKELVHKADLGNGYYMNPILDGDYADPAVFREGETYYLTVSTGHDLPAPWKWRLKSKSFHLTVKPRP